MPAERALNGSSNHSCASAKIDGNLDLIFDVGLKKIYQPFGITALVGLYRLSIGSFTPVSRYEWAIPFLVELCIGLGRGVGILKD